MQLVHRIMDEWASGACGVTIDVIGDSQLSSEFQWVIAYPLGSRNEESASGKIETLRNDLEGAGLIPVDQIHLDHNSALPNGISLETVCPFRPDSCNGDHLLATGHGIISEEALMPSQKSHND